VSSALGERLRELPPPTAPPLFPTAYAQPVRTTAAQERPRSVAWACGVTWVSTLLVFVLFGVYLVEVLVAPDSVLGQLRRQNPDLTATDHELRQVVLAICVIAMGWSAVAAVLAVLVWRRVAWAAVALGVSAGLASLTLLPVVACVAAGILLLRPEARAWLSR
jgi:small-conductance mechanosensitive channel